MITQQTAKGRGSLPCVCPRHPLVAQASADSAGLLASRTFRRRPCRKRPKTGWTLQDTSTDQAQTASGDRRETTAASRRGTGLDSCLHTAKLCTPGSRGAAKCLHGAVGVQRRGFVAVRAASLSEPTQRRLVTARFCLRPTPVLASEKGGRRMSMMSQ